MKVKSHQLIHMKEGWGINIVTINVSFFVIVECCLSFLNFLITLVDVGSFPHTG